MASWPRKRDLRYRVAWHQYHMIHATTLLRQSLTMPPPAPGARRTATASTPVWYMLLRRKAIQQHPTDDTLCTHVNYKTKTTAQNRTVRTVIDVVLSSISDSSISYPTLSAIPPTPPPSRAQLRAARRLERKLRSLDKLNQHVETLESEGFLLIYTDGSSEHFSTVGWVGGYRVYCGAGIEVSDFVPLHMKQTTNSAELLAAAQGSFPCECHG